MGTTSRNRAATAILLEAVRVVPTLALHHQALTKQPPQARHRRKATLRKLVSIIRLVVQARVTDSNHSISSKATGSQLVATEHRSTNSKATGLTRRMIKRRTASKHPAAHPAVMVGSTTHRSSITVKHLQVTTAQTLHIPVHPANTINMVSTAGTRPTLQRKQTTPLHRRWAHIRVKAGMEQVQEAMISRRSTVANLEATEVHREAMGSRVADMVVRHLQTQPGDRSPGFETLHRDQGRLLQCIN